MWRLTFCLWTLCVLDASGVCAAESRKTLQVGITITGNGNASSVGPKPAAGPLLTVPLPIQRPTTIGTRDRAQSTR
jgi:hypothetical protein